jgi:hypothetical protein
MKLLRAEIVCPALLGLCGSIMPTAVYGLFHMDSWAFAVSRVVFALA